MFQNGRSTANGIHIDLLPPRSVHNHTLLPFSFHFFHTSRHQSPPLLTTLERLTTSPRAIQSLHHIFRGRPRLIQHSTLAFAQDGSSITAQQPALCLDDFLLSPMHLRLPSAPRRHRPRAGRHPKASWRRQSRQWTEYVYTPCLSLRFRMRFPEPPRCLSRPPCRRCC